MTVPSPKDSMAQSMTPSSSFVPMTVKPMDWYQPIVALTSGTWIMGMTFRAMVHLFWRVLPVLVQVLQARVSNLSFSDVSHSEGGKSAPPIRLAISWLVAAVNEPNASALKLSPHGGSLVIVPCGSFTSVSTSEPLRESGLHVAGGVRPDEV